MRIAFSVFFLAVLAPCVVNFLDIMFIKTTGNDQCAWRPLDERGSRLLITDVVPDGVTDRAGIKDGDHLLEIDGRPFTSIGEAQQRINEVKPGESIKYRIQRGETTFETNVVILRVINTPYLAQFLLGLGFLINGFIVVMSRPQGKIQRKFAWYSIVSMMFFGLSRLNLLPSIDPSWKIMLLGNAFIISRFFAPVIFIGFFSHFPVRIASLDKRWVRTVLLAAGAAIAIPYLVGTKVFISIETYAILNVVSYSSYFIGLAIFVYSYFARVDRSRRKQLRPVLIGTAIGAASFAYTFVVSASNPWVIYLNPALLVPGILIPVVPVFFGYAIFKYRLMDIELVVRRSLVYSLVTASIAAVYILVVYGVGNFIAYAFGTEEDSVANVLALVVIAFTFEPIKQRIQGWIDRFFYQERYNYQKALLEFSRELPRQVNLEEILSSVVTRISKLMHIEKVAVILCDEAQGCATMNIDQECCVFSEEQLGLLSLLRRTKMPQSFFLISEEPDSVKLDRLDKEKLIKAGVVLAVPMFLKDRLLGMINVGPKMSGKVYSQEDIDLLSTVAGQAAIAIENSRLHKSEVEKERIKEELSLARRIQEGLLPKANPVLAGLDVAGISIPAAIVGGDYFDFIELDSSKLLVVVADVSGKGMSAALYMSKIQGMVQLAAHMYSSPKEMLINVNRRIFDGIERKSFITMILALFDTQKRKVRICRAGHNKALIGTNGKLHYLDAPGIGLGLERGPVFESELKEIVKPLTNESIFVFYTDGLTEAMNPQGVQFGEDAVSEIVKRRRALPASALQQTIITAVEEFRGACEQHDDLTMVVVKSGNVSSPKRR